MTNKFYKLNILIIKLIEKIYRYCHWKSFFFTHFFSEGFFKAAIRNIPNSDRAILWGWSDNIVVKWAPKNFDYSSDSFFFKSYQARSKTGAVCPSTWCAELSAPTRPVFSIGKTKNGPPPAPSTTIAINWKIMLNYKNKKSNFVNFKILAIYEISNDNFDKMAKIIGHFWNFKWQFGQNGQNYYRIFLQFQKNID